VSSRPDGDRSPPRLAPEDDWFAPPGDDWFSAASGDEPTRPPERWDDEPAHYDDDDEYDQHGPPGLGHRQLTVVLAAVGIVAVIAVAILVVRAFGGSDTTTTQSTPALTTEPVTTESATTQSTSTEPASTTPATTSTTPSTTTPNVTSVPAEQTLRPGMSGSSVLALQQALVKLGYDPGTPDGSYGPGTTQAVTAFQSANGLTADGVAGPATLKAINDALARG
jgi:putative peptidoglycan binding protein